MHQNPGFPLKSEFALKPMRPFPILFLVLAASFAQAQTAINAVYFGQTHVLKATDPYFGLVGNREALIKVHVVNPSTPASPTVTATLTASGLPNLVLTLTGPATLPASIPDGLGVVQHSFANTFTGYLPPNYVKTGLQVTVNAGAGVSTTIPNMKVGAPSEVVMTMLDVHYFSQTTGNYPANTFAEVEAKWPVADLEVRRLANVVFPELVIPPRAGAPAARIKSPAEYTAQTGLAFDGEQAAALEWNAALKRAAGRSGRWSLYYLNIYNASAGGQAGGFAGVGNGTNRGILHHELGHALSLPHWGDSSAYPYKGAMHGISAPSIYNGTHAGPAWAFDLRTKAFIPPTVQANNVGGNPAGTYKVDPMQGGGTGYQEPAYLLNHFSDYSVNQMRSYLHSHMVVWNPALGSNGSWAAWNQTAGAYTTTVSNNGVQFPTTRDTQVISIMATMSGVNPGVNMVYPPIGPYTSGLIRLFDPTVAADRTAANSIFSPGSGSDYCVRVVQGGVTKTYMLAASALTSPAPTDASSIETEAINLPASGGAVTKIELLSTPNVEDNGLPANPTVLYTWLPLVPEVAAFETAPVAFSTSTISMKATAGELAPGFAGPLEYRFIETTGNPGATSSGWQTSRTYTDTGLQAGTAYAYTVEMRAGSLTATPSAAFSVTTPNTAATQSVTVDSTQQFSLQSGSGLKSVTGLGTFNASGADKLVVVISTENANNGGTGNVYEVRYNGKVMTEVIQQSGGGNNGAAAIFYLDNPGAIGSGTIQVSAENPNGGIGCTYALSNTMPGFGASNRSTGSTINSIGLTTIGDRSVVIAVLDNAGNPNSAGTPTTTAPLTQASSGSWGSQWGGHASGYASVTSPTAITSTFSTNTGSGYAINIAVAEFPAQHPLPNRWIQTGGGTRNWTATANWDDGIVPNPGSGATMDFSTVNIASNTNLVLGADRAAQLWKFGDTSGGQTWTVNSGNTLTLAGTTPGFQINNGTTIIDSIVAGTAGLAKTGSGNLTLTAANTYTGPTVVNAGTLRIGNAGTTGSLNPASTLSNNASLVFNRTNTLTQGTDFASVISGSGSLTKSSSGTLILGGDNTYTGTTTISAGVLQIGNGGTTGRLAISSAITNNAALVFNRSNGIIQGSAFADGITGSGSLTNAGNGPLTLNSPNSYEGLTTVSAGAIKVQNANALGSTTGGTVVNGTGSGSASNARLELEGGITVTGETLTINGAGNFYGALSSTSGNNTWAGNVTIGSPGTRLGTTTGNTLTVSGIIDSGTIETGLIIRNQDLNSPVVLSGANTYLGDTQVFIGKLQIAGANNRLPVTSRLMLGSNGTNPDAEFDLNGRNQEVAGLELLSTATASKNSVNNSSATLSTLTVNPVATSAFAGILKGNLALIKTGAGTLTLSGSNTYTGATRIHGGVLQLGANDTLPTSTALALGSGASVGTLNLGNFNQTVASLAVNSDHSNNNALIIGSGRVLTVAGGFTVGFNSSPAANTTTSLVASGPGTLSITAGNFQLGGSTNSGFGSAATLDLSGLSNFSYSNTTGTFRVGDATNGSSAGTGSSTLILANTSTITAQTFTMNSPTAVPHVVRLGSAANFINADTLQIGVNSNRSGGTLQFDTTTGTLRIRNTAGTGRANMTVGFGNGNTAVGSTNTVDLAGHESDLLLGTLQIAGRTNAGGGGGLTGSFSFDTGTLDLTGVTVGLRAGTSGNTGAATGNLNLGGGTVIIGASGLTVASNTSSLAANSVNAAVNISGGAVSIGQTGGTSVTLGSSSHAGAGSTTASLNLSGGTVTLAGNLIRGTATGSVNSTLNLGGGILDMTGKNITGLTNITYSSGTLKNLGTVNTGMTLAGTGSRVFDQEAAVSGTLQGAVSGEGVGLIKQGTGTLTLAGLNTYTGDTTVNAGTLVLADNARLRFVIGSTSGTNNRINGTGTGTLDGDFDIDTTAVDASALTSGSWLVVETANLTATFGASFTLLGAGWTESSNVWTKTVGAKEYTFTEATGILELSSSDSYATWIDSYFPGVTNQAVISADADPDNDGIPNSVEMVLGGNPKNGMDAALLPTLEIVADPVSTPAIPDGNYLLFTYRRSHLSVAAGITAACETNSDLSGPWVPATGVSGVIIQVDEDFNFTPPAATPTDRVRVYVPRASNSRQFGRLKALVP
jgi:autotransporter-associated beta strand protein